MTVVSICTAVGPFESFGPLRDTLESVRLQTDRRVEVVLKTLGSHLANDISAYASAHPNVTITLMTGDDGGIYDALNRCASKARGEYVLYLGCGDTLADHFVVADIAGHALQWTESPALYGPVLLANADGDVSSIFSNQLYFGKRARLPWRNPCHSQGLLYKRTWLGTRPFRTDVGPLADMVHTYQHRLFRDASWMNRPISIFRRGGISNHRDPRSYALWFRGIQANCANFALAPAWVVVSRVVCRIGIALGK